MLPAFIHDKVFPELSDLAQRQVARRGSLDIACVAWRLPIRARKNERALLKVIP